MGRKSAGRWAGAAALAAAFVVSAPAPGHAACSVISAGPAYGQNWKERRQELVARGALAKPRVTQLAYVPRGPDPDDCAGSAAKSEVRYRLGLIAPTWRRYGHLIAAAAQRHAVPAELILASIVDESGGDARAVATNPGYVSDAATPDKVSLGLGQMLLSTARKIAPERRFDRRAMFDPATAIDLVARYHARFYRQTGFDPAFVAWTYLAGSAPSLRPGQRWYPRNQRHAARYTAVFEASVAYLAGQADRPRESFAALLVAQ